jgi:hypothetical protein
MRLATRAQIDRITRQVDRLTSMLDEAKRAYVPLYANETETEALRAYGQPVSGSVVFNRARASDRRDDCERSGLDALFRLGPSDVRRLLSQIDGKTRGIPTNPSIESFEGSEH